MKQLTWDLSELQAELPIKSYQIKENVNIITDISTESRLLEAVWGCVPSGDVLLEGVDDLSVLAEFADEALLSTQAAAEHVGAGKLDHLGEEGGQFTVDHLGEEWVS